MKKQILHQLLRSACFHWTEKPVALWSKKDEHQPVCRLLPRLLFLLCFCWATSASAQYSPVVTTGTNGCSTVGTYTYSSQVNGKPSYTGPGGNSIFWENDKWNLAYTGFNPYLYFFENTANTPLPPCGAWTDVDGNCGSQSVSGGCTTFTCPQPGINWTIRTSAANNNWSSVTYGNGLFVAVAWSGTGNRVMTSPNGINWTIRSTPADNNWNSVTFGNGLFVAVASSGTGNRVMTSPDGITWTLRTSAANNEWNSVTWGNGLFVAVAGTGTGNRVMTSPDGITWTIRTSAANNIWNSVTYGNGLFVAVASSGFFNRVMTSPDGINWTLRTSAADNQWRSVAYGNNIYVAVAVTGSGDRVMTSPNGITWTPRTPAADWAWWSVTFGNGLFVAVASTGSGNRVMTSPDGINWTLRTSAADNDWRGVTYANNLFVAVSSINGTGNRVMTSSTTLTPAASIAANPGNNITAGTSVTFTATPTNGGTMPAYQWKKNGTNVGMNQATYTDAALANGDEITCVMTSNEPCASPITATSNAITMTVTTCTPSVSIAANPGNNITLGTSVTFTATPTYGGTTPAYQWKKNGNNVGMNQPTYTDAALANGDVITCVMTSNDPCASPATATSNEITMTVNNPLFTFETTGFNICNGASTYTNDDDSSNGNVKVTFSSIPATGNLTLNGPDLVGGPLSVNVSVLSGTEYTFSNVKIKTTGLAISLTADFDGDTEPAYTNSNVFTALKPCSRFVFTGNGNWTDATQWQNQNAPNPFSGSFRHISVAAGANATMTTSAFFVNDSLVIDENGMLNTQSSPTFSQSGNGLPAIVNRGTWSFTGSGTASNFYPPLYNYGNLNVNGGSSGITFLNANAILHNYGTIQSSKTLAFYTHSNNYGTGVMNLSGQVNFSSGTFTNAGSFSYSYAGSTSCYSKIINSGTFTIQAGASFEYTPSINPDFVNTGSVVNNGALIFSYSPQVKNEPGSTITNNGILTTNKGMLQNGLFTNNAGATLNLMSHNVTFENNGTLVNNGTIAQTDGASLKNNNLFLHNAGFTSNCFSCKIENTDSIVVAPAATITSTGSNFQFLNETTGVFILDGAFSVTNQFSSLFENRGILKGNGSLTNAGTNAKQLTNTSTGQIQPGSSPGKLTIANLLNQGAIDIEIGGTTPVTGYDQLASGNAVTFGGTLNVTLVNGFTPSCGDMFDIITHGTASGTFATVNLPAGFAIEYLSDKVRVSLGVMGISLSNISVCAGNNTTCTTDDTFTADVTVSYLNKPASGTLALTGTDIVGTVPPVDVSVAGATSYTFTGVTLKADGEAIGLTATFSEGCSVTENNAGTAPACGGASGPASVVVTGFNSPGDNGTYVYDGMENGAPRWSNGVCKIYWDNSSNEWHFERLSSPFTVVSFNSTGTPGFLPCGDWSIFNGEPTLSGGCGSLTGYVPQDITVSGFGCFGPNGLYSPAGNANGAPAWISQFGPGAYFIYWDGAGTWAILDNTGNLPVVIAANTTGSATNLPCSGGWTDPLGVGCIATPITLTGGCGDLSGNGTGGGSTNGPACFISNISLSNTNSCINPGNTVNPADDYFTTDVTVTFAYAPASGTLTLKRGNTVVATTTTDLTCITTHTFENVQLASDGQSVVLTAEFSTNCTYTSGTLMTAPAPCSCQPTTAFTACPTAPAANTANGTCTASVIYSAIANGDPAPGYTYAFSGSTDGSGSGTGSGSTFNLGVTQVTVTATNDCGTATCQFSITVTDAENPSVTCKNATVTLDANGAGSIATADVYQSGSDNCGTVNQVSVSPNSFTCSNLGANQVTLTVNDGNGNTSTCTATVTVQDVTPPSVVCKNYTVALNTSGQATISTAGVFQSGSDNCGTVNQVSVSPNSFNCSNKGANSVTLTVDDGHGNTNTCTATVTIVDNTPPLALCKNVTVNLDANGNGNTTVAALNNNSSDGCGIASVNASALSFTCANIGPNNVTLTVTDVNGNISTCTSVVTVKDVTPPTVNCQGLTVNLNNAGEFVIDPAALFAGGSDNCGAVNLVSATPSGLTCSNIGQTPVTLKVNDGHGNSATCQATVTVNPFVTILSVTSTPAVCGGNNGSIVITATAPGGQLGYSINGGTWFNLTGVFNNVGPGTYSIQVTAYGTANCVAYWGTLTLGSSGNQQTWYKDLDGDGFTDGPAIISCVQPMGYTGSAQPGDCNDNDPLQFPGQTWYLDADNDGYSNGQTIVQCLKPNNYKAASQLTATSGDCNDGNPAVHPGAAEVCNGLDDNCNGSTDEGLASQTYVGNAVLGTQAQVNAWLPCNNVIQGNLTIQNSGVVNLAALANLRKVTGNVLIKSTSLTTLNWLTNLDSIGGNLTIQTNSLLTTLDGLENLVSVGGNVKVFMNLQLSDCCAIYDLINEFNNRYVGGTVTISLNKTGCDNITQVNADCYVNFNGNGSGNLNFVLPQGNNPAPATTVQSPKGFLLQPNPAGDWVEVVTMGQFENGTLQVFDASGKIVVSSPLENGAKSTKLDISGWETGMYAVKALLDGEAFTQKLSLD